jgi:hypothetical protein
MTPEEKLVIRVALLWDRDGITDDQLHLVIQQLRISRQPLQGPEPIPCMARASHSTTMFCVLPKGHPGSEPEMFGSDFWGFSHHQGVATNGSRRRFKVLHDTLEDVSP